MKYNYLPVPTDTRSRKTLNEKVLYLIDSGTCDKTGISQEDIYNAYTGDGGLHGLQRKDYDDYHSYSEKKKEIENGQFFTPPDICRLVAESLRPSSSDLIADLTCGKGSFFNFFPVESNLYGCEIDPKMDTVLQRFLIILQMMCSVTLHNTILMLYMELHTTRVHHFCLRYDNAYNKCIQALRLHQCILRSSIDSFPHSVINGI